MLRSSSGPMGLLNNCRETDRLMVQVVDSSNFGQFVETGKVDDYKEPVATVKTEPEVKAEPQSEASADDELTEDEKAAKAAMGPKKWDNVIGRRHRAQKEAEEARREA